MCSKRADRCKFSSNDLVCDQRVAEPGSPDQGFR